MALQIDFRPYRRPFQKPLRTARGVWAVRDGFILRVEGPSGVGFGEVAPLPEFGSETTEAAAEFLETLRHAPDQVVPARLPCCAFGLSAALAGGVVERDFSVSGLLPAGVEGLRAAELRLAAGYSNLKWKIGVDACDAELAVARNLLDTLPAGVRLRLDANASLTEQALDQWLALLATFPENVDYLEQPLPPGQEALMAAKMADTGVPIALDESLNGVEGAPWLVPGAWAGPLVVKAPLMGDLVALAARLKPVAEQVVFSSVFETGIGLVNSLRLANSLEAGGRPIGFDTLDAFDDDLTPVTSGPILSAKSVSALNLEALWNSI